MNIKNRLGKIERNNAQIFDDWIKSLSDEKLKRIVGRRGDNDGFAEWLMTLTDTELETIRYDKPGANALLAKFNKQMEKK